MQKQLLVSLVLAGCLHASAGHAQFGQNRPFQNNAPPGVQFLPRTGGPLINSQQFYPYGYGNPLNNYYNQGLNPFGGGNPYGNSAFNSFAGPYGSPNYSPFANPWQANNFGGAGFNNPYQTPWGFGNMYGNSAPFGGYQYYGYGNFAPIVGVNNGWWPYQPAYNYNNPVDQYLQQLFMSGLPSMPGGSTVLPR